MRQLSPIVIACVCMSVCLGVFAGEEPGPAGAGPRREGVVRMMNEPVRMGKYRELFVDDRIVGRMEGVHRTLNQPQKHPGNPVLKPDRPWVT